MYVAEYGRGLVLPRAVLRVRNILVAAARPDLPVVGGLLLRDYRSTLTVTPFYS